MQAWTQEFQERNAFVDSTPVEDPPDLAVRVRDWSIENYDISTWGNGAPCAPYTPARTAAQAKVNTVTAQTNLPQAAAARVATPQFAVEPVVTQPVARATMITAKTAALQRTSAHNVGPWYEAQRKTEMQPNRCCDDVAEVQAETQEEYNNAVQQAVYTCEQPCPCEQECPPMCQPDCPPVCQPTCPPVRQPVRHPDCRPECRLDCPPECDTDCPPVCQPTCPPVRHPDCQPDCPPECNTDCPPVCQPTCPPVRHPVCPPTCPPAHSPCMQPKMTACYNCARYYAQQVDTAPKKSSAVVRGSAATRTSARTAMRTTAPAAPARTTACAPAPCTANLDVDNVSQYEDDLIQL